MANINSMMTTSASSTSNLYGTRNVLSGLASGMDTEAMIENSVSGYKTKITQLQQQQTKCEWKQDAYRSITDKMYDLSQKYVSYTSNTNLMSNAFFNRAVSTQTVGVNKDNLSAVGKSTSDIQIYAAQAATAARYYASAGDLGLAVSGTEGEAIDPDATVDVGKLKGSMTLTYGSQTIDIDFNENDTDITDLSSLASTIQDKLSNIQIGSQKASDLVKVDTSGGKITFGDKQNKGNSPYISSVSGNLTDRLGVQETRASQSGHLNNNSFGENIDFSSLTETKSMPDYLDGKTVYVELDGVGKHITLKKSDMLDANGDFSLDNLQQALQRDVEKQFGSRISVGLNSGGDGLQFALSGSVDDSSTLKISGANSQVSSLLGLGEAGLSNKLNADASLETLLSDKDGSFFDNATIAKVDANGRDLYELKINDQSVYVSREDTMSSVMNAINSNSELGVTVSYSKLTGQFAFTARETGAANGIRFGDGNGDSLAEKLFGTAADETDLTADADHMTQGSDATVLASVNGQTRSFTRASNSIEMDGMTVTIKNDFGDVNGNGDPAHLQPNATDKANAVSFSIASDSDNVVNTIKSFVDEYNALLKEVYEAYTTQPAEKSSSTHAKYEPLTEDDKASMSDKAVENYEAKAKQGLLFGDNDLRSAYETLLHAVSPTGADGATLRSIGIDVSYSQGLTQIKLDESKLRSALETKPDTVRDAFTKSKEYGASSNGLMTTVKSALEQYGSTSLSSPGILVSKAGNAHSSTSLLSNELQKKHDSLQQQIENWQSKMSAKIDYYTRQFTALEKLMNTMNSQSSALSGLMGGY